MLVKNIAGHAQYFGFGRSTGVRGRNLDNNETADIPDTDPSVRAQVNSYYDEGLLDILDGPDLTRRPPAEVRPAFGWVKCLANILDGHTIDIGGQRFEFAPDPGGATLGEYNSNLSATDNVWAGAPNADDAVTAGTLKQAINNLSSTLNVVARTERTVGTETYIPIERNDDETDGSKTALSAGQATLEVPQANFYDGIRGPQREQVRFVHTVTSAEASEGIVMIATGIANPGYYSWQTVDASTNQAVGFDGTLTVNDGVFIFSNDNTAHLEAGDAVHLTVEKA